MKMPALILSLIFSLLPLSVLAHTGLKASTPAQGAVLASSPPSLELAFSAPVRLMAVTLETAAGEKIALDAPSAAEAKTDFTLSLPALGANDYRVNWTVMGGDAHKMSGTIAFTVGGEQPAGHHNGH